MPSLRPLLFSCLVLLPSLASGQTPRFDIGTPQLQQIFVDPERGDDRASGRTAGEAVRTLIEAWNRVPRNTPATAFAASGYEIQLLPGRYESSAIPHYMELRYGSATAPVVFRAAQGRGTAMLRAGLNVANVAYLYLVDVDITPDPAADVFHCESCDHVLLRGVTFDGGPRPVEGVDAPVAHETVKVNQSTHVYIEDSTIGGAGDNAIDFVAVQDGHILGSRIHGAGDWCGYVKGGSANILVDGNEFHDCGTGGFTVGQGTGLQFMTSPWLHYEAYGIRVVNNFVHDTDGAGLGVNGGYNVLIAWNTLYRVGRRSHLIETGFGARSCDAADVAAERTRCEAHLAAGAWGTTVVDNGDNYVRIPNRHVFIVNNVVFNPEGVVSEWQHFQVAGAFDNGSGEGVPASNRADDDLRIAGNVIWNGPREHALGLGDNGCHEGHATCSEPYVRGNNRINSLEPSFVNLDGGDARPTGALAAERSVGLPDFDWSDRPSRPQVPDGPATHRIAFDRNGRPRGASDPPGAALPVPDP